MLKVVDNSHGKNIENNLYITRERMKLRIIILVRCVMRDWKKKFNDIEQQVGKFSTYATNDGRTMADIPLGEKPAGALLMQMLGKTMDNFDLDAHLTKTPIEGLHAGTENVTLSNSFSPELTIAAGRLQKLHKSARVYLNPAIWTADEYKHYVKEMAEEHDVRKSPNGIAYQNRGVGVCHAQRVDMLVDYKTNSEGLAVAAPKKGTIGRDDSAILMLSAPALNFNDGLISKPGNPDERVQYGVASELTLEQRKSYTLGMYRLLFSIAVDNGCTHICMPAAGVGIFLGDPNLYFPLLMQAAKEFPELNIIYHPGHPKNNTAFQKALAESKADNVVQATKDVFAIAEALRQKGVNVALHNPSDADVVYGVYDVGEYWKTARTLGTGFAGEENAACVTSCVIGSRGLNPDAYDKRVTVSERMQKYLQSDAINIDHLNNALKTQLGISFDVFSYDSRKRLVTCPLNASLYYPIRDIVYLKTIAGNMGVDEQKSLILNQDQAKKLSDAIAKGGIEKFVTHITEQIRVGMLALIEDLFDVQYKRRPGYEAVMEQMQNKIAALKQHCSSAFTFNSVLQEFNELRSEIKTQLAVSNFNAMLKALMGDQAPKIDTFPNPSRYVMSAILLPEVAIALQKTLATHGMRHAQPADNWDHCFVTKTRCTVPQAFLMRFADPEYASQFNQEAFVNHLRFEIQTSVQNVLEIVTKSDTLHPTHFMTLTLKKMLELSTTAPVAELIRLSERFNGPEFSYPTLIQVRDGKITSEAFVKSKCQQICEGYNSDNKSQSVAFRYGSDNTNALWIHFLTAGGEPPAIQPKGTLVEIMEKAGVMSSGWVDKDFKKAVREARTDQPAAEGPKVK